jgi:hypothetical protein
MSLVCSCVLFLGWDKGDGINLQLLHVSFLGPETEHRSDNPWISRFLTRYQPLFQLVSAPHPCAQAGAGHPCRRPVPTSSRGSDLLAQRRAAPYGSTPGLVVRRHGGCLRPWSRRASSCERRAQGWSHPYGKVWRLSYLNFSVTPSPKLLPAISASSRWSFYSKLLWMFWRSLVEGWMLLPERNGGLGLFQLAWVYVHKPARVYLLKHTINTSTLRERFKGTDLEKIKKAFQIKVVEIGKCNYLGLLM